MRFLASVLAALAAVSLLACGDMMPTASTGAGGTTGAAAGGAAGAAAMACQGFKDIDGACWDATCFGGAVCNNATAGQICLAGVNGPGVCKGGVCVWENTKTSCSLNADCGCGLCGSDGHCYEDEAGGCGKCMSGMGAGGGAGSEPACTSCIQNCAGTGPSCCKGCGCACEGVCGLCH